MCVSRVLHASFQHQLPAPEQMIWHRMAKPRAMISTCIITDRYAPLSKNPHCTQPVQQAMAQDVLAAVLQCSQADRWAWAVAVRSSFAARLRLHSCAFALQACSPCHVSCHAIPTGPSSKPGWAGCPHCPLQDDRLYGSPCSSGGRGGKDTATPEEVGAGRAAKSHGPMHGSAS